MQDKKIDGAKVKVLSDGRIGHINAIKTRLTVHGGVMFSVKFADGTEAMFKHRELSFLSGGELFKKGGNNDHK